MHRAAVLLSLLVGAGCGVVITSHPLNPIPAGAAPRLPAEVAMFTTSRPPWPYVEASILEARQESTYSSSSSGDVLDSMRARAGEMGCDGLIVLGSADEIVGSVGSLPGADGPIVSGSTSTLHGYRATCVVRADAQAPNAKVAAPSGALVVTVPGATVRTGPSDVAPEVAKAPPGTRFVEADPPRNDWCRVRMGDGRWGFVRALYVHADSPAASAAAAPPAAPPVVVPAAARAPASACEPICSPGYACNDGVCVAQCNPACGPDGACGGDRICRKK